MSTERADKCERGDESMNDFDVESLPNVTLISVNECWLRLLSFKDVL
jgi:hypothetical protein